MAISEATRETLFLRGILQIIGVETACTVLSNDCQSAHKMVKNPVITARSKHIDIRIHFVREVYEKGIIAIEYIPSQNMPADVLTKGLGATNHYKCISHLGSKIH